MRGSLYQCELWPIMDYFQFLVLALHITQILTKSKSKKYETSSSDEDSIENLLYYKDCQRTAKEPTEMPIKLRYEPPPTQPPPRQPDCPFPKMCCALSCGNECGNNQPAFFQRQMEPVQPIQPIQPIPQPRQPGRGNAVPPQIVQRRKKKIKFQPNKMQSPIASRRAFSGLTKEKIKGLISQDDDIRKILKDLVRVTMQKVDLMEMINSETGTRENVHMPAYDEYDEYIQN